MMAPAGTPIPILEKTQAAVAAALRRPDVAERLTKLGFEIVGSTPATFDALIKSDTARNTEILRAVGVTPN